MAPKRGLVVVALVLACGCAAAERLGSVGPTYPISEPSFLAFIEARIRDKQNSGELARVEEEARKRNVEAVRNPKPVSGLVATEFPRTFYYDPTFELDHNLTDQDGRVLFPAGTRKNPLEVVSLSKHLLFFDGRDERQVKKAEALMAHYQGRVKPILVGGSFLELMEKWRVQVFYDQQGSLTGRLGVQQVPALVSQDGLRLRIDELAL